MSKKKIYAIVAIAVIVAPLALLLHTFSRAPLPMPTPYAGLMPPAATPPKEMAVYSLVAGVNHRVAAFGYRGCSLFERRDFAMAGALEKHPKGTCSSTPDLAGTSPGSFEPCLSPSVL